MNNPFYSHITFISYYESYCMNNRFYSSILQLYRMNRITNSMNCIIVFTVYESYYELYELQNIFVSQLEFYFKFSYESEQIT